MAFDPAADTRAAQDRIATLALSLFAIHGYAAPGGDKLGSIVHQAMAAVGPEELRRPETISMASLGRIDELVRSTVEAGKPRNIHGAEAARAAQAAGGDGARTGFGYLDAVRNGSSARFRELGSSSDSSKGSGTSYSGASGTGGVTPEFARSFAGTGMSSGTLRTFADVGLDRGTFNEFRKEGFSNAQIADNARDVKALSWHGKEDLSIAQHASTDVRKAAVATEQAKTPEQKKKCQERENELERKNEERSDSDPQKHHNRRFFERRHQDNLRHDAQAGLGSAAKEQGSAASLPKSDGGAVASRKEQDAFVVNGGKKQTAALSSSADDAFGTEAPTAPAKPAPTKSANAKPAVGSAPT